MWKFVQYRTYQMQNPPSISPPETSSSIMDYGDDITSITPFSLGPTPEGSISGANIFSDPSMNSMFNKLDGERQSQILQLDEGQRQGVMREIMRKSAIQSGGGGIINKTNDPLGGAFKALPLDKQFVALQGGYTSMARDFKNLAAGAPDPMITINKPVPVAQQLAEKFPLLAIDNKSSSKTSTEDSSSQNNTSSSNSSIDSSDKTNVKKISF